MTRGQVHLRAKIAYEEDGVRRPLPPRLAFAVAHQSSTPSAPDPLLEVRGIAVALHLDLRQGAFDALEIVRRQLNRCCPDVLLEPVQFRRA